MSRRRRRAPADEKAGVPGWMVSFGDMMTLILTFFILLVSLAEERKAGLVAKGLGSFVVRLQSYGLSSVLSEERRLEVFDEFRRRFNLPPEEDPERREDLADASNLELVRAKVARWLEPHDELFQPAVAAFERDSSELTAESSRYLDHLAGTLRPARGQVLILEGRAGDAGPLHAGDDARLAYARALAVRDYLIERHDFQPARVEARTWLQEVGPPTRAVDARLVTPAAR